MEKNKFLLITSRILIGIVFAINIQAGFDFYFNPQKYSAAYELSGIPGEISVAGAGLLFLMWNIPYVFAIWHPVKHNISLIQANLMQFLGVAGESILLFRIPQQEHPVLTNSITRFIIFDGAGLVFLICAFLLVFGIKKEQRGKYTHVV